MAPVPLRSPLLTRPTPRSEGPVDEPATPGRGVTTLPAIATGARSDVADVLPRSRPDVRGACRLSTAPVDRQTTEVARLGDQRSPAHPAGRVGLEQSGDAVEQHRADGTEQTGQHGSCRTALPPDELDPHLRRHLGRAGRIRDDATVHDDPTFTDVAEGPLLRDSGLDKPVQDGSFLGIQSTSRRSHDSHRLN